MKKYFLGKIQNNEFHNEKMHFPVFLILLFNITSFSQSIYSNKFLEQSSMEELNAVLSVEKKYSDTVTMQFKPESFLKIKTIDGKEL
jgi:anthranilate/para-aminobenzoate synthase component II